MSRELTNPRPPQGEDGVEQNITAVRLEIAYEPDPPNGTAFNVQASRFFYQILTYSADGELLEEQQVQVSPGSVPGSVRDSLRDLLAFCDSDGAARGLIDPGTYVPPF